MGYMKKKPTCMVPLFIMDHCYKFGAIASCTQHFWTCTQHNCKNSKSILYSGNENLELKIMHSRKIDPKEIIVFRI